MSVEIKIINQLTDNYAYIIYCNKTKKSLLVDPSEPKPILDFLYSQNLFLKGILITHHHSDHTQGIEEIKKKFNPQVFSSNKKIPETTDLLTGNQKIELGFIDFKIITTPGHTLDHIVFYCEREKILFSGDALFYYGCGRIFEGTYEQMFESLNKLKKLPVETKIYCGHEYTLNNSMFCKKYEESNKNLKKKIFEIKDKLKNNLPTIPSTIGEELACNIFLRAKNLEDFSKLRDLKDNF